MLLYQSANFKGKTWEVMQFQMEDKNEMDNYYKYHVKMNYKIVSLRKPKRMHKKLPN